MLGTANGVSQGNGGTFTTTSSVWDNGTGYQTWSAAGNTAVFGADAVATGGTVTLTNFVSTDTTFDGSATWNLAGNLQGLTGVIRVKTDNVSSSKTNYTGGTNLGATGAVNVIVDNNSTWYQTLATGANVSYTVTGNGNGENLGALRLENTIDGAITLVGGAAIGNFSGTARLNGIISGTGTLTKAGDGTHIYTGANTYTGITAVSGGFISVANIGNTGAASNLGTNGTLDITTGTGGYIYTGTGETTDKVIRYNSAANGGVFTNNGAGTLTFSNIFGTTGTTGAFGVTFGGIGNTSIVGITNPGFLINFNKTGTGLVTVTGSLDLRTGELRANGGILRMAATSSTGSGANAGAITRANNGVLQIANGASVYTTTTNTNGIVGGWATFDNATWAVANGSASTVSGLSTFANDAWAAGANIDVTTSSAITAKSVANTLRFNTAAANTQTLSGINQLTGGGILVSANVGNNASLITGGNITRNSTAAANGDLIVHQHNTANTLTIASVIGGRSETIATTTGVATITVANGALYDIGMTVNGTGIAANTTVTGVAGNVVTLSAAATATASNSLTFAGTAGGLTKVGAGTLVLTGVNTYTGGTRVLEGTLQAGNTAASNGSVTLAGGNLTVSNGVTYNIDFGLTFASANNATVAAASGTATLRGFDVNSADIIVNTGVNASIASSVNLATNSYGIRIDNTGNLTVAGAITGTGTVGTLLNSGTMVGSDVIGLFKRSTGDLTLTGAGTFSGGTSMQEGRLILSGGSNRLPATGAVYLGSTSNTSARLVLDGVNQTVTGLQSVGTGTLAVVGNNATLSTLTVNNTNNYTFAGTLGGTGTNENNLALVKSGAGTFSVSRANTYTGGTTVNGGILALNTGGPAGAIRGTVTVNTGATLRLDAGDATGYNTDATRLSAINLVGGTLAVNTTANQTLGSAVITMTGASITGIASSNIDFFGGASALTTLASATTSTISGARLSIRQTGGVTLTVADGAAATDLQIDSVITNNGSFAAAPLIKAGAGTLALNAANTHTGATTVSAGTLRLGNNAALGTTAEGTAVSAGAVLDLNGAAIGAEAITLNGTGVSAGGALINSAGTAASLSGTVALASAASLGGSGDTTLSGVVSGAGSLTKVGAGTITLTGTNTYAGGTTVSEGTLTAGNVNAFGSGTVAVNGGSLNLAGLGVGNTITVGAAGRLLGASAQSLASVTFADGAGMSGSFGAFDSGTLAAKALNTTGGATFTTLSGQGAFSGGLVTVTAAHNPGNSPGTQTFATGLTYGDGVVVNLEIAADGSAADFIHVTGGGLTIGTGVTVNIGLFNAADYTNAFWDTDHTFTLLAANSISGGFDTVSNTLGGAGEGTWNITHDAGGITAAWTASAIPEPSTYGLLGAGTLAAVAFVRRRRAKRA